MCLKVPVMKSKKFVNFLDENYKCPFFEYKTGKII